jgi:uncharacterized RDD family membrane protein YckC
MEVWIILNGEKAGPFHDFEIRRKITLGELPADTPAWFNGLPGWKPLDEIELFSREFEVESEEVESTPPLPEASGTPPPLPVEPVFLRRFWARWLDLSLYSGVWWLGMWAAGQDIGAALINPWIMFFRFIPWFVLEAVLIQRFATTPGKWLLGLHVVNQDGSHLDFGASTRRSMRVLFSGIGFGFSYLSVFCQILSLVVSKRLGTTLWDATGGHKVTAEPPKPGNLLAVIIAYAIAIAMQWAVTLPEIIEESSRQNPELKEYFENHPVWSLPRRN